MPSFAIRAFLKQQQRAERHDRRQRAIVGAQLCAEVAAAVAALDVAADRRRELAQALGGLAELEAHLLAGELARLGRLGQADPRAHQQRLDARHRRVHDLGDLLVGEGVHLAQHERRALRLRKVADVVEQQAELLAAVGLLTGGLPGVGKVGVHRVHADRRRAPHVVERAVARDPVEPRPRVDLARVGHDRVECRREDLLEHVLGVLARAQHVPAESEQPLLVARDEGLERRLLAGAGECDQPLVAGQPQQGRRPAQGGQRLLLECVALHGVISP